MGQWGYTYVRAFEGLSTFTRFEGSQLEGKDSEIGGLGCWAFQSHLLSPVREVNVVLTDRRRVCS